MKGPWGQLLGRDLQWVAGADYRREAGSLTLDPLYILETGETVLPAGAYDAKGLFAEVQVPLLHGLRWHGTSP